MDLDEIAKIIDEVLRENPDKVKQYKQIQNRAVGHIMGQVLKRRKDFSPMTTRALIIQKLDMPE